MKQYLCRAMLIIFTLAFSNVALSAEKCGITDASVLKYSDHVLVQFTGWSSRCYRNSSKHSGLLAKIVLNGSKEKIERHAHDNAIMAMTFPSSWRGTTPTYTLYLYYKKKNRFNKRYHWKMAGDPITFVND